MKVSGDNPVFVEHVKPGQAAHKAGLLAGDMILKVNNEPVRYSSHVEVVKLIKASEIVKLTIQRSLSHVLQRPQSMSASMASSNSPSTPVAQRSSITAPLPVDVSSKFLFLFMFSLSCVFFELELKKNKNKKILAPQTKGDGTL